MSWKLVGHAPKAVVQAALAAHEALDEWDGGIVLTGSEIAEDRPDEWVLEAYLPHRPDKADKAAITALFGSNAPRLAAEISASAGSISCVHRWPAPACRTHQRHA